MKVQDDTRFDLVQGGHMFTDVYTFCNAKSNYGFYYDESSDSTALTSDSIEDGHVYCLKEYMDFCDW